MKCFVCSKSNINVKYKPFLSSKYVYICSQDCYKLYCKIYSLSKLDVTVTEMEKRLSNYRTEKGGLNQK